jgi:hypothetical protein
MKHKNSGINAPKEKGRGSLERNPAKATNSASKLKSINNNINVPANGSEVKPALGAARLAWEMCKRPPTPEEVSTLRDLAIKIMALGVLCAVHFWVLSHLPEASF